MLLKGFKADITVFDPDEYRTDANYHNPTATAKGVVNLEVLLATIIGMRRASNSAREKFQLSLQNLKYNPKKLRGAIYFLLAPFRY